MKISFFTPIILVSFVFGLNPKKLPNGKSYKYIANKLSPSNDLKVIEPSQAAIISRNWLQNIIADMFSSTNQKRLKDDFNDNNLVNYDDLHIVTNINKLESYIHSSYEEKFKNKKKDILLLFLAWMPESTHGRKDALFIIVVEIDSQKKEFIIRHLVQSPFWEPSQIDSNELRLALENQNEKQNCTTINLDYLYENDLRYKLAWATWNLNMNNSKNKSI